MKDNHLIIKFAVGLIIGGLLMYVFIDSTSSEELEFGLSNQNNILWKLSGGNLLPSLASWGITVPSLSSSGDCLVTDASGVVSTSACGSGGGGGGTGLFEYDSGTDTISPITASTSNTAILKVSSLTATGTPGTATSTFAGAVQYGTGYYWDAVNGRLSIGGQENSMTVNGVTKAHTLTTHITGGSQDYTWVSHVHSNTVGSVIAGARTRGSEASPTIVADNDNLLDLVALGYDGTDYEEFAAIHMDVCGTPGNNDAPGCIRFLTTPDGSTTLAERMRIDNAGNVGIGTTSPTATLSIEGSSDQIQTIIKGYSSQTNDAFQVLDSAGVSNFTIGADGDVTIYAESGLGTGHPYLTLNSSWGDTEFVQWGGRTQITGGGFSEFVIDGDLLVSTAGDISFGSFNGVRQAGWVSDGNEIIAQRNVSDLTSPNEYRIYNTYTDASNYEFLSIGAINNANVFTFETEALGTGTVRDFAFIGGNVGIGSTTPSSKLTVTGDVNVSATTTTKILRLAPVGTQSITAASDTLICNSGTIEISSDGDYVMTSTPTIATSTAGTECMFHNTGTTTIDLQANSVLSGSSIHNEGVDSVIEPNDSITVRYLDNAGDGGAPGWIIQSHPNPTATAGAATPYDVRNTTGSAIAAFKPVYKIGFNAGQNRTTIGLADADDPTKMPAIGVTHASIANNANGTIITAGEIENIDTSTWTTGDILYIDTTAGDFTTTRPAIDDIQSIGRVSYAHATKGIFYVTGAGRTNNTPWNVEFTNSTTTNAILTNATSTNLAVTTAFNFLGTIITNVSTWFNGLFDTQLATKDTDDLTEGATNLYSQWSTIANDIYYNLGLVGIGTTTPNAPLTVYATTTDLVARLYENTGGEYFDIQVDSAGDLRFVDDAGVSKLEISDAAEVIVIPGKFEHDGDSDTEFSFNTDQITLTAGGLNFLDLVEAATDIATALGIWDFSGATVKQHSYPSVVFPSVSPTTTTATSTILLGSAFTDQAWNTMECRTTSGTAPVVISDGTNVMDSRLASTTVGRWTLSTNNTFAAEESRQMDVGPLTAAQIVCSFDITENN